MWIFTTTGFVSAVQDWNDTSSLVVRARDRASLESLAVATLNAIEHSPTADYPYRLSASKAAFALWASQKVTDIDYPNFKSEVAAIRGDQFAHALMKVWSDMHAAEDPAARLSPKAGPAPEHLARSFRDID